LRFVEFNLVSSLNMTQSNRMAQIKRYEGGCLCGHIRFKAQGPAEWPHTCSCRLCQRHSGALTVAWVEFDKDRVQWTGKGGVPATWRSSEKSSRAFCPKCGSTLGAIDDAPTVALMLGSFDAPNRKELAPVGHSYVSARPRWWHVVIGEKPGKAA
jgi:hypothetical protein